MICNNIDNKGKREANKIPTLNPKTSPEYPKKLRDEEVIISVIFPTIKELTEAPISPEALISANREAPAVGSAFATTDIVPGHKRLAQKPVKAQEISAKTAELVNAVTR